MKAAADQVLADTQGAAAKKAEEDAKTLADATATATALAEETKTAVDKVLQETVAKSDKVLAGAAAAAAAATLQGTIAEKDKAAAGAKAAAEGPQPEHGPGSHQRQYRSRSGAYM